MLRMLVVFCTDELDLYGSKFTVGALHSGLVQCWGQGIPGHLGHDLTRPVCWSRGLAVYIEPAKASLAGLTLIPEKPEEFSELRTAVEQSLLDRVERDIAPHLPRLREMLGDALEGEGEIHTSDDVALVEPGLAERVCPDLFALRDKAGLVDLKRVLDLTECTSPGIFDRAGLRFFAHPFYRRAMSRLNTPNAPLLQGLLELVDRPGVEVRIALDSDMVGLANNRSRRIELEYWWGPHFSDDLASIDFGVAHHEADETERMIHGVTATQFRWYAQDGRRTFECEELVEREDGRGGEARYGCRFAHSIVDPDSGRLVHADGAVRLYDDEAMLARLDKDLVRAPRASGYVKLWRVDGALDLASWKRLLNDHYRDNSLVGEYFGGLDAQRDRARANLRIPLKDVLNKCAPANFNAGDGVRIALSYQRLDDGSIGRAVMPNGSFFAGTSTRPYIEAEAAEVLKILRRGGSAARLPDGFDWVTFEDRVTNLPVMMHAGSDAYALAQETLAAISTFCSALQGEDRLVAFHIGVHVGEGRAAVCSVAGHLTDVIEWLNSPVSRLASSDDDLYAWCDAAAEWVKGRWAGGRGPDLADLLHESGLLLLPRVFLDHRTFEFRRDEESGNVEQRLYLKDEPDAVFEACRRGEIAPALAFFIRGSRCTLCEGEYQDCDCSHSLGDDVAQMMTDVEPVGSFWSRRAVPIRVSP